MAESVEEWANRLADAAPPLADWQRARLRELLMTPVRRAATAAARTRRARKPARS